MSSLNPSQVEVLIEHPHGDIRVPLLTWIEQGPGPRYLLKPIRAYDRTTGEQVSLSAIPWRYRNTWLGRLLVRLRVMTDPWTKDSR